MSLPGEFGFLPFLLSAIFAILLGSFRDSERPCAPPIVHMIDYTVQARTTNPTTDTARMYLPKVRTPTLTGRAAPCHLPRSSGALFHHFTNCCYIQERMETKLLLFRWKGVTQKFEILGQLSEKSFLQGIVSLVKGKTIKDSSKENSDRNEDIFDRL